MITITQISDIRSAYKRAKALDVEYQRAFRNNKDAQDLGMRPMRAPAFLKFTKPGMDALVASTEEADLNVRPKDCQSRMDQYARLFVADSDGETEYSPYMPNASLCVYIGDGVRIGLPDGLTRGKTVSQVLAEEGAPDGICLPILFVDDEGLELIRKYADYARTRELMLRVELALKRGKELNGFEKQIVCRAIKTALGAEKEEYGGRLVFNPSEIEEAVPRYRDFFTALLATEEFKAEKQKDPKVKLMRSASGLAALAHVYNKDKAAGEALLTGIENCILGKSDKSTVGLLWAWIGGRKVQSTEGKTDLFRAITYIGKMLITGVELTKSDKVCKMRNYLHDTDCVPNPKKK